MERFAPLQKALFEDMTELLQKISDDPDNFGFALAVPTDYGAACILYAIGKIRRSVHMENTQKVSFLRLYNGFRIGRACHE